jgi:beta-galactosidase GanA
MLLDKADIKSGFDGALPYGCTAHTRTDGENTFVFLENYSKTDVVLDTKYNWQNIETGEAYTGKIPLNSYETRIITKK